MKKLAEFDQIQLLHNHYFNMSEESNHIVHDCYVEIFGKTIQEKQTKRRNFELFFGNLSNSFILTCNDRLRTKNQQLLEKIHTYHEYDIENMRKETNPIKDILNPHLSQNQNELLEVLKHFEKQTNLSKGNVWIFNDYLQESRKCISLLYPDLMNQESNTNLIIHNLDNSKRKEIDQVSDLNRVFKYIEQSLQENGHCIIQLDETYAFCTRQILEQIGMLFSRVHIMKPYTSAPSTPRKYFVGINKIPRRSSLCNNTAFCVTYYEANTSILELNNEYLSEMLHALQFGNLPVIKE